jgi:hydroxyacylglutathione hydrolase
MTTEHLPEGIALTPIAAFTDNYIWCLNDATHAVVVDPGDADPVLAYLTKNKLTLSAILITHHHHDHTGGIAKLASAYPDVPVIGPRGNHIRGITKSVSQGDAVHLPILSLHFQVMEVPGHTLDHIAFFGHDIVFCGDTLFSAGCGRLFEGSPEQMLHSLNKLKRLPDSTTICGAHEYTLANVDFALAVESDNNALIEYQKWAKAQRNKGKPTLPSTLSEQKKINPFLRSHELSVKTAAEAYCEKILNDDVAVFAAIRSWKDKF